MPPTLRVKRTRGLVCALDRPATRLLDLTVASALLLVLSPLLLVVTLLVQASGPGGALYRQTRIGAGREPFVMYKFRTMHDGCDPTVHAEYVRRLLTSDVRPDGGLYKLQGDARVTRVGAFLRRSSIDELPQLVNVLKGDMSLVGPRPALPYEVELFPAWASARFSVRPGVTGLWQVSGRNHLTMLDGLRLDLQYVERRSVWGDLVILLRTVPAVIEGGAR